MIPNIGGPELIILLVIVLLLFGAKRIPELARGLGSGMREFKNSSSGKYDEVESEKDEKKTGEKEEDFDSAKATLDEDEKKAEARSESSGNEAKEPSEARQEQRG